MGNPRLNTMAKGESMLVNAKLVSNVSELIMGGGNSYEVAIKIIKLVKEYDKEKVNANT